jgi:hypothetical protein
MAVVNTLAYYNAATIRAVKSFIVQSPGRFSSYKNCISETYITKLFTVIKYPLL